MLFDVAAVVGRRSHLLTFVVIGAASLLIAFSFGWEFLVQNQNTYLAHAIAELNPELLNNDWFVSRTEPYHWGFKEFVVLSGAWLPLPVVLPSTLALLISLSLFGLYGLVRKAVPAAPLFCFAVIGLWFVTGKTESVAGSYLFDNVLQASSFSVACLLLAVASFASGRLFTAGLLIAVGGAFHSNYLLLSLPTFGLAFWLGCGSNNSGLESGFKQRFICLRTGSFWIGALRLLGPAIVVLAFILPGLLKVTGDPMAAQGAYIFTHVRSPWHYLPERFLPDFLVVICWCLAAALCRYHVLPGNVALRRLAGLWTALAAIITVGTLLTTVVFVQVVDQLFVWRLAPLLVLLSSVLLVAFIVGSHSLVSPFKCAVAFAALLAFLVYARFSYPSLSRFDGLYVLNGLLVLAIVRCLLATTAMSVNTLYLSTAAMLVLFVATVSGLRTTMKYSTALYGVQDKQEAELYEAAHHLPEDVVFLIPPELQGFRLHALRAVVIDWKSTPYLGTDLVEWHRRISRIAGRAVRSEWDAVTGYARMDRQRLRYLTDRYDVDYVVFDLAKARWHPRWPPVFVNERFALYATDELRL